MPSATVTSKGQVTLPKKVREALRMKVGDQIDFLVDARGGVRLRAGRCDANDLKGVLHRPGRAPVTLKAIDDAIARRGRKRR
jgi:AbrB family looped-hinge helix DNA binding protein